MNKEEIQILIKEVKDRLHNIEKLMDNPMKIENIAVKVSTLREANMVANHQGSLPFDETIGQYIGKELCVVYPDEKSSGDYAEYGTFDNLMPGYTAIEFDFWAAQKGVNVPKFVMTSEDGIPFYEGDKGYHCVICQNIWQYYGQVTLNNPTISGKTFSTKESAQNWINDQNKPKLPVLIQVSPGCKIELNKLTLRIHIEDKYSSVNREFSASFINGLLKQMEGLQ